MNAGGALAAYRRAAENDTPGNGLNIGGKPPTKRRAEPMVSVSDGQHNLTKKPRRSEAEFCDALTGP